MAKNSNTARTTKPAYNDTVGTGGETHQVATSLDNALTTNQGLAVSDDQNSLKAGPRGAVLLEDFHLREKITHFDHERIPERVVHARGYAAHGFFQAYPGNDEITVADFLCDPKVKTPVFCRFSTVAGSEGSFDTARDVRGFAVKFYTQQGNYDLVGNNLRVSQSDWFHRRSETPVRRSERFPSGRRGDCSNHSGKGQRVYRRGKETSYLGSRAESAPLATSFQAANYQQEVYVQNAV